jgi:hypothetical protein
MLTSNGQAEEVSLSHTKLFRVLRIQLAIMCSSYIRLHHGHVADPALRFDWICKLCMLQRRMSKSATTSAQMMILVNPIVLGNSGIDQSSATRIIHLECARFRSQNCGGQIHENELAF